MNFSTPSLAVPDLGRIDACQTARILGFPDSDIPVLIRARLLRPLGNPGPTAPRFFSATEIRALAASREFLDKAQRAVSQNWQQRNRRRTHRSLRTSVGSETQLVRTKKLSVPTPLSDSH